MLYYSNCDPSLASEITRFVLLLPSYIHKLQMLCYNNNGDKSGARAPLLQPPFDPCGIVSTYELVT